MKILMCHNYYQQPGGEDRVFAEEVRLLEENGHDVQTFTVHNDAIRDRSRLAVAVETLWNRRVARELRTRVEHDRFDLVHFHNTFPLISPAAYYAVRSRGIPVVQTLHNYRLLCPNALFMRNGAVCEDCLGKRLSWPGVLHGCYKGSRSGTAVLTAMQGLHRGMGTWNRAVTMYIALSEFSRGKFIAGGIPAERICVKPNFVSPVPELGKEHGNYAIFVGRLSIEKGLDTLLAAWKRLPGARPLKIVGDGPLAPLVKQAAAEDPRIEWCGSRGQEEVFSLIGDAAFLVLPSACYENCPRTILEAYAKGTPVVASRLGAMAEFVIDGRTGVHFTSGDAADLAAKIERLWQNPADLAEMRSAARSEFEQKYTAEQNIGQLEAIYADALSATKLSSTLIPPDTDPLLDSSVPDAALSDNRNPSPQTPVLAGYHDEL